jgi:hypothetical protein
MKTNELKILISKLRLPIHINYISEYILHTNINETKNIIDELIKKGLIIESSVGKDYYVLKNL